MPEHNEISKENQTFSGIKMPAIINFYEFTGIKKFNVKDYNILQEEEEKKFNEKLRKYNSYKEMKGKYAVSKNWYYIILAFFGGVIIPFIIILVAIFIGSLLSGERFSWLYNETISTIMANLTPITIILGIGSPIIVYKYLKNRLEKLPKVNFPEEVDIINEKKYEYLSDIYNTIKNIYLKNFRILHISQYEKLFFGNEGCVLINIESGRAILYSKENIKNVMLEHKHLGSSTSGYSYTNGGMDSGGQLIFHVNRNVSIADSVHYDTYVESEHESETTEYYEWHLDILTDFMEYPNLSFVFDDDSEGIREAKVIYGIFGK
ncbi:hypothetical protein FACS1894110_15770 [Spirochaetia bacterium]|nr:hypothetical protein FACS1894110_15770 [Spirochaetia bacterium]